MYGRRNKQSNSTEEERTRPPSPSISSHPSSVPSSVQRIRQAPHTLQRSDLVQLQRLIGNQAVSRLVASSGQSIQRKGTPTALSEDEEVDLTSYGGNSDMREGFEMELDFNGLEEKFGGKGDALLNQVSATKELVEAKQKENKALEKIPTQDLMAVYAYSLSGYDTLNAALRTPGKESSKKNLAKYKNYILSASAGLSQLPPYVGTVYRGTDLSSSVLDKYQENAEVTEHSFTSTTKSRKEAEKGFGGNTLYVIGSKTGRDISALAHDSSEEEVLFAPGTRFKVKTKAADAVKQTMTVITMDEV